jgi:hypothetical protein
MYVMNESAVSPDWETLETPSRAPTQGKNQ